MLNYLRQCLGIGKTVPTPPAEKDRDTLRRNVADAVASPGHPENTSKQAHPPYVYRIRAALRKDEPPSPDLTDDNTPTR